MIVLRDDSTDRLAALGVMLALTVAVRRPAKANSLWMTRVDHGDFRSGDVILAPSVEVSDAVRKNYVVLISTIFEIQSFFQSWKTPTTTELRVVTTSIKNMLSASMSPDWNRYDSVLEIDPDTLAVCGIPKKFMDDAETADYLGLTRQQLSSLKDQWSCPAYYSIDQKGYFDIEELRKYKKRKKKYVDSDAKCLS